MQRDYVTCRLKVEAVKIFPDRVEVDGEAAGVCGLITKSQSIIPGCVKR